MIFINPRSFDSIPHHFKFPTLFKGVYTSTVEIPGCGGGETTAPPSTNTTC